MRRISEVKAQEINYVTEFNIDKLRLYTPLLASRECWVKTRFVTGKTQGENVRRDGQLSKVSFWTEVIFDNFKEPRQHNADGAFLLKLFRKSAFG